MLLTWILVFSLSGTVATVAGSSLLLACSPLTRNKFLSAMVSYAAGTLLAVSFLRLLPEALEMAKPAPVMATVLIGVVLFFLLEKMLLWRHCHDHDCEVHSAGGPLIIIGDSVHNLVDGVLIAAAFLTSISLGIATAIAIIIHEVPQEVGDFSILLDHGYKKAKAMTLNILSSLATVLGAVIGYAALDYLRPAIPYVLALSAASFIYIATVDLIANMHRQSQRQQPQWAQIALLFAGIATIMLASGLGNSH